ncbi:hypothetical protein [Actinomadura yumaensis]|uniref:Uncharacterized protein n=1 Tax=Actinomadura yumaensis TaxID=111807 RepID=A0ABW2CRJ0_9ACTN
MPPQDHAQGASRSWRAGRLQFIAHKDAEFERLHPRGRGGRFARKPWVLHHHDGDSGGGPGRAPHRAAAAVAGARSSPPEMLVSDDKVAEAFTDAQTFLRPHPQVPSKAKLAERAAMVQKKRVVDRLTERLSYLPDETVIPREILADIEDVRAGRKVWVRAPAEHDQDADPDSEFLHPYDSYTHFTVTPSEAARMHDSDELPWAAEIITSADQIAAWRRSHEVNRLIASWAETSNSDSPLAHALQDAAGREFGLDGAMPWPKELPAGFEEQVAELLAERGEFLAAFLREMWEETQAWFAARGITHVTLRRGMVLPADGPRDMHREPELSQVRAMRLRPMSAFSIAEDIAEQFVQDQSFDSGFRSGYEDEVIMRGTVPVQRVIGHALTGFGCLFEDEMVVLYGPGDWEVEIVGQRF